MERNPLVSIDCITYNHAPYIRQCLDSFIMQRTTFAFEVLIYDDASTDGTPDIIKEYELKYPDIIKPIYQVENQYSKGVKISITFNFPRAKGKYIALCEGDDYWIDPFKLQKQVDFLEKNEEYVLCYGKAKVFDQRRNKMTYTIGNESLTTYDLIIKSKIPTLTIFLRQKLIKEYINENAEFLSGLMMGDYPLVLWFSTRGKFYFFDEVFAIYRKLEDSASHFSDPKKWLDFTKSTYKVKKYFGKKYLSGQIEKTEEIIDILYNREMYSVALKCCASRKEISYYRKQYKSLGDKKDRLIVFASKNMITELIVSMYFRIRSYTVRFLKKFI